MAALASPETRYARTAGGAHIAYQVVGDGPLDVVFIPWWWNNAEAAWEEPGIARFYDRLSAFARLIVYDQRGTGLSDPVALDELPSLAEWVDDLRAVLDAAGCRRVALVAHGDGSLVSLRFAASFPERTEALVVADGYCCLERRDDQPWAQVPEVSEWFLDWLVNEWGTGRSLEMVATSKVDDEAFRRRLARAERLSASPGTAVAIQRMVLAADLRELAETVQARTLVIAHADNRYIPAEHSRALARRLPDATYAELPGADHLYWAGDVDALADLVEGFLTGGQGAVGAVGSDRVLATVLFTDIVASTGTASTLGDEQWRRVLDRHDAVVRRQIERFRGREINTVGDGFVAVFDTPGNAIRCAGAIRGALVPLGIAVRAGLHTGEIEIRGTDVAGIAVHLASRVSALAGPGEVLVSRTVVDLVTGSGITFEDRGPHELKGIPGEWQIFRVKD
jgi:class 3 adenylate cyclase